VRFDRFGIYGYNGINGAIWHPKSLDEVRDYANFSLTWDGLYLNLGNATYGHYYTFDGEKTSESIKFLEPVWHGSTSILGKTNDYIYNSWVDDISSNYYGLPYYDESSKNPKFVRIFSAGGQDGDIKFSIYDDGTVVAKDVKFTGKVQWIKDCSPSRSVYRSKDGTDIPEKGTHYTDFPENEPSSENWEAPSNGWHTVVSE
jgi:hypothetical protein